MQRTQEDDSSPFLTRAMISGPRDVMILYQRSADDGTTKYKIQRTLAGGVRDISWYTVEQLEDGVLSPLLVPYVKYEMWKEAARVAEQESQEEKDPFAEGWLYYPRQRMPQVVTDVLKLKANKNIRSVQSMEEDSVILDLYDCTDAQSAQKRGEISLKVLLDGMVKKPVKFGSGKSNLDGLVPGKGCGGDDPVGSMWRGAIAPELHPLNR